NLRDDVPALFRRIENASPIRKAAFGVAHLPNVSGRDLDRPHIGDRLRNFLSVGADVLHRSAAHSAGDAAHALDACAILLDGEGHELVPIFAGPGVEQPFAIALSSADSGDADLQYESGPAGIGHYKIAAPAEHEQWQRMTAGMLQRLQHFALISGFNEKTRRASDLKGGVRRKREMFADFQSQMRLP